jgi:hypothetical protein
MRNLGVAWGPGELKNGLFVPIQLQPAQTIEYCANRLVCGALAISILYSQQKLALIVPGKQPVEKRSARTTYVQKTSGAGGEPYNWFLICQLAIKFRIMFHRGIPTLITIFKNFVIKKRISLLRNATMFS